MKIMIAGNWSWVQYEQAFADALISLGNEVVSFSFQVFFKGKIGHYQNALPFPGPALWNLNRALLKKVEDSKPDVVLIWRGTHIRPRTLNLIKSQGVLTVSYNNDDPFGPHTHGNVPWHHHFLWMWYLKCLKQYDITFVYRPVNIREAINFGAKNVYVLKPYFIPAVNYPLTLSEQDKKRFECDVVYIGHHEPDGRDEYLRALVKAGLHVRLFGDKYWTKEVLGDLSSYFKEIVPVYGEEYTKALCGAKMCLSFLSKLNRDTYTRRCFEIPACGRLLLCERTDDLKEIFIEGKEAVFFSSKEELAEKAVWLKSHPDEIERIAAAGKKKVWENGYDVKNKAKEFLNIVAKQPSNHQF